jgi:hypothetical protein
MCPLLPLGIKSDRLLTTQYSGHHELSPIIEKMTYYRLPLVANF